MPGAVSVPSSRSERDSPPPPGVSQANQSAVAAVTLADEQRILLADVAARDRHHEVLNYHGNVNAGVRETEQHNGYTHQLEFVTKVFVVQLALPLHQLYHYCRITSEWDRLLC